ncbi:MAG TPA: AAA family ATPase, partial [Acidimicrobiia bacterium]
MYLKTVKLVGFKSFADRTRLEFRPGVAVVVGPNGSGKSNLVDAIHWVLGTQAPKSLRTSRMEDVIFAGTSTRPALNRAEVTVILDNGIRDLPLDLDEVAITRRLYRDGSSDYEINGVECRLLDVQDLLSDSGVGRHQHIIVNQGQVDLILSAGPDEHRAVIEEAAGILKHRLRKDRAIRRLEHTDEDVLRIRDLLSELNRQLRPLRRQAAAADRHQALAMRVRLLTLFLAGEDLRRLDRSLQSADTERSESHRRMAELETTVGRTASELRELTNEASVRGAALDRDSAAAARLETTLEKLRRVAQVSRERHRAGQALIESSAERRSDLEEEKEILHRDLSEAAAAETAVGLAVDEAERRFRRAEDEERSLSDREQLPVEGALAVVEGELRSLLSAHERDQRELEALSQRAAMVTEHRVGADREAISLRAEIEALDVRLSA